jgi:MinD-like ATPase involved in chromosome partitioning or flagellar assembly
MRVPVLTAVVDPALEAGLVAALERADDAGRSLLVVRRCVDLADLLATAATGQARAVLLSPDLRRLDRDAVGRLLHAGVAVVGLAAADPAAADRLRRLGVEHVVGGTTPPASPTTPGARPADLAAEVVATVHDAVAALAATGPGAGPGAGAVAFGDPRAALPGPPADGRAGPGLPGLDDPLDGLSAESGRARGRVLAVWGPTGAPGRTTVAVALASEAAALGRSALLVDADVHGGVVAQVLGLLDESPGLAAACRLASAAPLELPALGGLAPEVAPGLRVLTGIARADRWPELRPAAVEEVLDTARGLADLVVVDCGFGLEQDEELSFDTAAPRRHGATLAALGCADVVVAVGSADPVGLQRLVRGLADLRAAVPDVDPVVVLNRVRGSAVPGDAAREVAAALERYAGTAPSCLVPLDVAGLDTALAAGRTLAEAAPSSPARRALQGLAADLVGAPRPVTRGWRRRG